MSGRSNTHKQPRTTAGRRRIAPTKGSTATASPSTNDADQSFSVAEIAQSVASIFAPILDKLGTMISDRVGTTVSNTLSFKAGLSDDDSEDDFLDYRSKRARTTSKKEASVKEYDRDEERGSIH